jgi:exopolysaccharide biosynthesis polyprenyl glycosylphosphotransferase
VRNSASLLYSLLLIIGDFFALVAAFSIAYILRVKFDDRPLIESIPAMEFFYAFLAIIPLWLLVHAFIGLYRHDIQHKRFVEMGRLLVGSFIGILVVLGYDYVIEGELFPARLVPVYALGLSFLLFVVVRNLIRLIRNVSYRFGVGISNVLIVGNTQISGEFARQIGHTSRTGQKVVGIVGANIPNYAYFPTFSEANTQLKEPIHGIIQTELYTNQAKNNEILRYAQEHHVAYRFIPGNSDLFVGNIDVELFRDTPMIAVHQTALTGWGRVVKRLSDIFFTLLAMIIALPLILIISFIMKLLYPRNKVFFKQTRLTRFNTEFQVYKFRTMYQKYSGMTPEQAFAKMGKPKLAEAYRENGDYLPNDPRIPPIGRFLRKTSLDELPQLFNVLKGDLSLVGPRALVPEELNAYAKRHAILSVKSGLTGLAQISGRRSITFEERRRLDMYYVQNWSFWLDITILFRTIRAVLAGIGAK